MVPKISKILYASDLSDNALPAFSWAMSLAHQHDARISFLHVIETVPTHTANTIRSFMGEDKWTEMTEGRREEVDAEIKNRITRFCDQVKDEISSCPLVVEQTIIERGSPAEVILQTAESNEFDLIVMGTHGAGVFKDAMIGSTARRVLRRSNKPVFVIPLLAETTS